MKKIIVLVFMLIANLAAFGQSNDLTKGRDKSFGTLTFEVQSNKTNYLPFEPIFIKFRISNQTEKAVPIDDTKILTRTSLKIIDFEKKVISVNGLSLNTGGGESLPGSRFELQSSQFYEENAVPAIRPELLAKPGNYKLQFFVQGLESNVLDVKISVPHELDQEAFDFINQHGKDIWFGSILEEKNGDQLLKSFVEKFSNSGYGSYATISLGRYYLFFEKNLDKAQAEFEKIKDDENVNIAQTANKLLMDVGQKRDDLRQTQSSKP